jgi:hypothetical protein
VKTFLCPVGEETEEVDIPSALRTFSARYLPAGTTSPTVNLLRRWYHTKLHALASNENTLFDVFKAIDAHSANVAKNHCILRGPEDDAMLAKHLVHAMLGTTAPWPSAKAIEEGAEAVAAIMNSFSELDGDARGGAADADAGEAVGDEDEVDDEELEWFENADYFGIAKPMEALLDAERVLPGAIADVCDGNGVEEEEAERERMRATTVKLKTGRITKERKKAKRDVGYERDKTEKNDKAAAGDKMATKDATGTKRKAASDHVPARPMLPRMLLGVGALRGRLSKKDDELNQLAEKACRVINIPGAFKMRYFMTCDERRWATDAHDEFVQATGAKGDMTFCERLYQWGVFTSALSELCSPAGLRSLFRRHLEERATAETPASKPPSDECRERVDGDADGGGGDGGGEHEEGARAGEEAYTCEDVGGELADIMNDILNAPNPNHVAQVAEGAQHASARSSNEQAHV